MKKEREVQKLNLILENKYDEMIGKISDKRKKELVKPKSGVFEFGSLSYEAFTFRSVNSFKRKG